MSDCSEGLCDLKKAILDSIVGIGFIIENNYHS